MVYMKQARTRKTKNYEPPIWIAEALKILKPPEKISVSEYADQNRILGAKNAEPGKWNTSRTPYLKDIMNTYSDPDVEDVSFVKPTQVGGTECLNNMLGFAVSQEGASNLYVLPTDELSDYTSTERIQPMIRLNSKLNELFDEQSSKMSELRFRNDADISFCSANSPSGLASKPKKNVFADEVDKYPLFSGKEADPLSLAKQRQLTFRFDKFTFATSTPTIKQGPIWKRWLAADRRFEYYVPCPFCGHYQVFSFKKGIKWDKNAKTAEDRKNTTFYVCEHCHEHISDRHKQEMLRAGVWKDIETGEELLKIKKNKRKIAFRINAIYSPWLSFGDIAYEFTVSKNFPEKLMNFVNSWLAEAWEQTEVKMNSNIVLSKQSEFEENVVPNKAIILTAGVDVQASSFYYTIRAWGAYMTSWNITHGHADSWSEVESILNRPFLKENGEKMQVNLAAIDSGDGNKTDDIYDLCAMNQDWLIPIKGSSRGMISRYKVSLIDRINSKAHGLRLYLVDGGQYKDMIAARLNKPNGKGAFMVFKGCDEEYAEQLCSEEKVPVQGKDGVFVWKPKTDHIDNHYLDCEVYAALAADVLQVRYLVDIEDEIEEQNTNANIVAAKQRSLTQKGDEWIKPSSNWLH